RLRSGTGQRSDEQAPTTPPVHWRLRQPVPGTGDRVSHLACAAGSPCALCEGLLLGWYLHGRHGVGRDYRGSRPCRHLRALLPLGLGDLQPWPGSGDPGYGWVAWVGDWRVGAAGQDDEEGRAAVNPLPPRRDGRPAFRPDWRALTTEAR